MEDCDYVNMDDKFIIHNDTKQNSQTYFASSEMDDLKIKKENIQINDISGEPTNKEVKRLMTTSSIKSYVKTGNKK